MSKLQLALKIYNHLCCEEGVDASAEIFSANIMSFHILL